MAKKTKPTSDQGLLEDHEGKSLLQRCLRVLIYRDKLRQAQAALAERHMRPLDDERW